MKRKRDEGPIAQAVPDSQGKNIPTSTEAPSTANVRAFSSFGLDSRLLQSVAKEGFSIPTQIQTNVIPVALEGKDILARSKTGSGKTAAYVLPVLQFVLKKRNENKASKATIALVLVPTRELAQQVSQVFSTFATFCSKDVRIVNLTQRVSEGVQRSLLAESPDIVISTPSRIAQNIRSSALSVHNLQHLVVDESDLVLSYGYDDDIQAISKAVPQGLQTILMSATLTDEVNSLKCLFCRDPVIIDLQDDKDDSGGVSQYVVRCAEDEKFLLAFVIFKLQLIKGKCIIFVGDTDRCYRLKLFFEQFGIKSCILNSELPVNSRIHVVQEFNKNVYDIIIAADEREILETPKAKAGTNKENHPSEEACFGTDSTVMDTGPDTTEKSVAVPDQSAEEDEEPPVKQPTKAKKSKDYGVSRGIDFHHVSCVLNFDLPTTSKSYTHRIGRTARAGKKGVALSFVVPRGLYRKHPPTSFPPCRDDEEVLDKISRHQQKKGKEVKPYHFDTKQVDGFRYRMNDALKAVTRIAVREARTRELRQELLKSEKLKRHFEENPDDLQHLRHDSELRATRIQPHLRHVPDYLMPSNGKINPTGEDIGFVGFRKSTDNRIRKARLQNRMKGKGRKASTKRSDPLKTFNAKGRR
ncbi:ATP-dependent DNA/RNA helicase [Lecanora helva]